MNNSGLYKTIRIQKIAGELKDFKTFTFQSDHPILYKAGQYLTLVHLLNGEEVRRSYSIASSPLIDESICIGVKRITNGFFSRMLIDHAKEGDELITTGAGGFFVLPDEIHLYRQIFFLAAGSGITPIYSLLKTVLYQYPDLHVVLIYSNRSPNDVIFLKELEQLKKESGDRFHIEYLFSNSLDLRSARLNRELLINMVIRFSTAEYPEIVFYTCGPLSYMRMCIFTLQEMNVPAENIKKETFIVEQKPPPQNLPPDHRSHFATIQIDSSEYKIQVQYPDSILQAAKKNNLQLPYSCETGRCGNCVALCKKGSVWMSYNEVLTDKEMSKGLVLTCVGHPIGGDVELMIKLGTN